ncbi:LysR family transcriptional regulator [Fundicoccus culcitae]|uniref:LysR family transcriptional regulator n=1 Tax=Fundicoccus culcitae TaxID=2969821 RepID=A0ABY5P5M7_9LACT|nr:LysR family transcriptional regulator [Fundicoccus culcitae]UUX34057.1 LysR family transcriptional regulator [Fundicoccus culcitae]
MDRRDIEIFNTIVAQNNITHAANELFMSPSTVGARLKAIEDELDMLLIERQKGSKITTLTKEGEELAKITKKMGDLWKEVDEISELKSSTFKLTVGATDSFYKHALIPIYKQLMHKEDQFKFSLRLANTNNLYTLINQKFIDVAFLLYYLKFPDLLSEKLFEDIMVVMTPKSMYPDLTSIHPNQLNPQLEIMIKADGDLSGWGQNFYTWHNKWFEVNIEPLLMVNTLSLASNFFDEKEFWIIIPKMIAHHYAEEYDLKVLTFEVEPPIWECYMVTREVTSPKKREAIDILKHEILNTISK